MVFNVVPTFLFEVGSGSLLWSPHHPRRAATNTEQGSVCFVAGLNLNISRHELTLTAIRHHLSPDHKGGTIRFVLLGPMSSLWKWFFALRPN